uniref:RNase H type-1 domain-containing protein n=1 Tax=Chenopodium quinoa TaxID=63459 RepID=A0A803N455_CHEQI
MVRRVRGLVDVVVAEAMAARLGVELARRLGFKMVEIECNAINVAAGVCKKRQSRAPIDLLFDDIDYIKQAFELFLSHLAARLLSLYGREQLFVDDIPQGLTSLAEIDFPT